ncbi:HlyD family type I secretion periplasmic adaptor subunit [Bosea sp. NBC_00550]|uniref:HlyD family type I secretion periplasmic adaptor subunit n=1 Tax=Bosea sp. NBC_00550 TaxID=2969621 RepID=UPI002231B056|nr:HlyD family type I secretion periplasmic adaptor subunit [Bosea sp. NBC_00550]UZF95729.1 HlyD family type I secretion periplasmic adaptor subunit [Bosea sp. NBC_00550]
MIGAFLAAGLVWANFSRVEEVTRGSGRVIPSARTQVVQSAEAGVVREILVRQGQRVTHGELLIRLDDTPNAAKAGEAEAQGRALRAQIARLEAETTGPDATFECPTSVATEAPAVCLNERRLLTARQDNVRARMDGLQERFEQRKRELGETAAQTHRFNESLTLAEKELSIIAPMASRNLVSQLELIRTQRQVVELKGQLAVAKESKARLEAALREASSLLAEQTSQFRREALAELTARRAEWSVVQETLRGAEERVRRTDIRSPVDGIVNSLAVNTVGAYVNPGERLLDIVPSDGKLLIEARVKPSDIAFIVPRQKALIKISAYDFYQYGGLTGVVEQVSADSVYDPNLKETFYIVLVRSDETSLKMGKNTHSIIPGMTADVDIVTGEKSILSYLLKPINRARHEALTER